MIQPKQSAPPALEDGELVAVGQVVAIHRQLDGVRIKKSWPLYGWPTRVLVGSDPSCDWVFPGARKRHCLLRWDGRRLIVRGFGKSHPTDQIVQPLAPLQLGAIELTMSRDHDWDEPTTPGSPIPLDQEGDDDERTPIPDGDTVAVRRPRRPEAAPEVEPMPEAEGVPVVAARRETASLPVDLQDPPALEATADEITRAARAPAVPRVPVRAPLPVPVDDALSQAVREPVVSSLGAPLIEIEAPIPQPIVDPMPEIYIEAMPEPIVPPPAHGHAHAVEPEPVVMAAASIDIEPMPEPIMPDPIVAPMPETRARSPRVVVAMPDPLVARPPTHSSRRHAFGDEREHDAFAVEREPRERPAPLPGEATALRRVEMLPTSVFTARAPVADDAPTNAVRPRTPSRPLLTAGAAVLPAPPTAPVAAPLPRAAQLPRLPAPRTPSRPSTPPRPRTPARTPAPSQQRVEVRRPDRFAELLAAMRLFLVLPVMCSSSDVMHPLTPSVAIAAARPTPAAAPAPALTELPSPPPTGVTAPAPGAAPRPAARASLDCTLAGAADPTGSATPEDHAALQLAIEAYRLGHKDEARVLFQTLTCRPEVGPPARYMLNLLAPHKPRSLVDPANTALWLPQGDRIWRLKRLFEEADREIDQHAGLWAQRDTLAHIVLANPALRLLSYSEQPKCNIFVGELLYRAGFVSPGTPLGDKPVAFPNVNEMVAQAQRLARSGRWNDADGVQWFDVVPIEAARPGDLLLIDAAHRGDIDTEHGHVEIIRTIVHRGDALAELSTVGARSAGAMESPVAGRMFGEKDKDGEFRLSRYALVARPRLR